MKEFILEINWQTIITFVLITIVFHIIKLIITDWIIYHIFDKVHSDDKERMLAKLNKKRRKIDEKIAIVKSKEEIRDGE